MASGIMCIPVSGLASSQSLLPLIAMAQGMQIVADGHISLDAESRVSSSAKFVNCVLVAPSADNSGEIVGRRCTRSLWKLSRHAAANNNHWRSCRSKCMIGIQLFEDLAPLKSRLTHVQRQPHCGLHNSSMHQSRSDIAALFLSAGASEVLRLCSLLKMEGRYAIGWERILCV